MWLQDQNEFKLVGNLKNIGKINRRHTKEKQRTDQIKLVWSQYFSKKIVIQSFHLRNRMQELFNLFNWEVFPHPSYSLDLAPSDFYLCLKMKTWLTRQRFDNNEELQVRITE
uniref:Tc1-like transposase DDE domain-containing protein n=1 Tax=Homalodisca liturata TaxID=320908 RepID=A0A1B6JQH9_9HEMI